MLHRIMNEETNSRRGFAKKLVTVLGGLMVLSGAGKLFGKTMKAGGGGNKVLDSTPYIGEIALYPYNFVPQGWLACNGATLAISSYTALFQLIGTTYGGDGQTTFMIPNLMGRVAINQGQGSGLSNQILGTASGTETVQLTNNQLPSHTHTLNVVSGSGGTKSTPVNNYHAFDSDGVKEYTSTQNATMKATAISFAGNNVPHNNIQPYMVMTYCIATDGQVPTQS